MPFFSIRPEIGQSAIDFCPIFENRPIFGQITIFIIADSRCDTNNFIKHMNYIDNQDGKYSMSDLCHYFNILIVEDILSLILSLRSIF